MAAPIPTCYRHPDRRAGVTCQRCDRPICPQCMHQASVGFHCPECSKHGRQRVYTASTLRSAAGGPLVTQVLIGINALVFLLEMAQGVNQFIIDYGLIGSGRVFVPGRGIEVVGVAHGEWWRLVTGGFLHANLLHIGFNMFALWILGAQLEAALGRVRFGVVYAVSLLAGSLGVMLLSPDTPTVGASGAIFGLFGVALAAQRSHGIDIWQSGLGGILVINLAFTFMFSSEISVGGHLGGLAGGYLCGVVLYELGPRVKDKVIPLVMCSGLGVLCLVSAIAAANAHVS
jgi:membrane associated rhomboid family serine protease